MHVYMASFSTKIGVINAGYYDSISVSLGEALPSGGTYWGVCQVQSGVAYWGDVVCSINNITPTGFTLNYGNKGAGPTGGDIWIAWIVFCYK